MDPTDRERLDELWAEYKASGDAMPATVWSCTTRRW